MAKADPASGAWAETPRKPRFPPLMAHTSKRSSVLCQLSHSAESDTEELYATAPLHSCVSTPGQRIHLQINISHEDL